MSDLPDRRALTLPEIAAMKPAGTKIVMVTAYDHPSARLASDAGIDIVLVGDSAGNNVLGYETTVPVGMDETAFRPIANEYRMERDRQESCYWDYDTVDRAFQGLLGGRGNKNGRGTQVTVTYHDVGGRLKAAADAFKSSGVFDQVADELRNNYSLREPVQFNAQRCGEANAFYDPDTVEVIFCYELMQDYMELFEASMPEEVAPAPRQTGVGKEKTSKF